ncbi:amyloid-beta A4 precursor protein-binding family B member 3 isoform X2 [Ambystoma mexicanum]|uniref:amyloid-beta A4 precursor protein-binding family B member 3 isoform X2 n=1 Tax=Ambystoma mexicanum TaxID=8296 RepID=UPI0037E86D1D
MLGKDYMLAIILVNYDDNVWNDQNLEPDPHLPPGWRTIRDTSGTYYWHVPTGTTQWHHPGCSSSEGSSPVSGETILQETGHHHVVGGQAVKERPFPVPSLNNRRSSLSWPDEDLFHETTEPGSKCFAVRSLGWVEIPEEDLAPGKSGITVNNCIQQLTHSKCDSINLREGQNMVMILKKDTMSLVDPFDHSLIHSQPIVNIRVWGVGCNNGRDFAFVANDKDTCMLKCHVFRCDVPAKAIASALHGMCSQIISEKAVLNNSITRSVTLETISPEDLPLQGIEVLNETIEKLTSTIERERWQQGIMEVSDTVVAVHPPLGSADDDLVWDCQVRYVTFIGVGKDPRTFALIVDVGNQRFHCAVFWCEPDAGNISEAVQAACMVQYQKCLVATTSRAKASSHARSFLKMKRTASVDSPISPFSSAGHSLQKGTSRKRGMMAIFEAFKQKHSVMHTP